MNIDNRLVKVSIDEVQEPKYGQSVITDSWWVAKDGHVLGFKPFGPNSKGRPTPQCNRDKRVAEKVLAPMYPGYELVYLPVAYWQAHTD